MSHLVPTTSTSTTQALKCSSKGDGSLEFDDTKGKNDVESGLKIMRSGKGPGDIETIPFLRSSLESVRQGSDLQDSMVSPAIQLKVNQSAYDMQPFQPIDCHNSYSNRAKIVAGIQFLPLHHGIPARDEIFYVESNYCCEGTSKNHPRINVSENDGTSAVSRTLQGRFVSSPSYADSHLLDNENFEFDKVRTSAPLAIKRSFIISNHQMSNVDLSIPENKDLHDGSWSVNLGFEGRMDSRSRPKNSVTACYLENKTSMVFDPAPTNNNPSSKISREWFRKIPKCSGFELFPGLIDSGKTEVNSMQKGVKCNHNVESMRICTAVDSVADPGQCPVFCQPTHSLLITKKTDLNLFKEGDICGSRMANGNTLSNVYNCDHGKRKLKLPSPSKFTTCEAKRNFHRVKTSKVSSNNEYPPDTDPVDIRPFIEMNPKCGANSIPMNKDISVGRDSSPQKIAAFLKQAGCPRPDIELPDINLVQPTPPDTGTSPTAQSSGLYILMASAEEPKNQSGLNLDDSPVTDPSNCWVKRLKVSSSNSASGTRSCDTDKYLSHEKMKKVLTGVLNISVTGSETTVMKPRYKGPIVSEGHLSKKDYCLSKNLTNEGKDVLLPHAWIQRWLSKGLCKTKPDKLMCNVPKSSNSALDGPHKMQFPSTAAMALMGRTMNGFRPCELQKRGSSIVWNTKVF